MYTVASEIELSIQRYIIRYINFFLGLPPSEIWVIAEKLQKNFENIFSHYLSDRILGKVTKNEDYSSLSSRVIFKNTEGGRIPPPPPTPAENTVLDRRRFYEIKFSDTHMAS